MTVIRRRSRRRASASSAPPGRVATPGEVLAATEDAVLTARERALQHSQDPQDVAKLRAIEDFADFGAYRALAYQIVEQDRHPGPFFEAALPHGVQTWAPAQWPTAYGGDLLAAAAAALDNTTEGTVGVYPAFVKTKHKPDGGTSRQAEVVRDLSGPDGWGNHAVLLVVDKTPRRAGRSGPRPPRLLLVDPNGGYRDERCPQYVYGFPPGDGSVQPAFSTGAVAARIEARTGATIVAPVGSQRGVQVAGGLPEAPQPVRRGTGGLLPDGGYCMFLVCAAADAASQLLARGLGLERLATDPPALARTVAAVLRQAGGIGAFNMEILRRAAETIAARAGGGGAAAPVPAVRRRGRRSRARRATR